MGAATKIASNGAIPAKTVCALNLVKTLAASTSGLPVNPKKSDATGVPMKNPNDASGTRAARQSTRCAISPIVSLMRSTNRSRTGRIRHSHFSPWSDLFWARRGAVEDNVREIPMFKSLMHDSFLAIQARSGASASMLIWAAVMVLASLTAFVFLCVTLYVAVATIR